MDYEGYCVKCRAKKKIQNGARTVWANGRAAWVGVCPTCGTKLSRVLGKA